MQPFIHHTMSVGLLAFILCGCATSDPDDCDYGVVNRPVRLYDISQVEVTPSVLFQVLPVYPYALQRNGVKGEALIGFFVSTDGSVSHPVIWSATDIRFGESAREAVRNWRYKPAEMNGTKIRCMVVDFHSQSAAAIA